MNVFSLRIKKSKQLKKDKNITQKNFKQKGTENVKTSQKYK